MDRTNTTKVELFEEQDEVRIIVEKLKEKIRTQGSIEASCDESLRVQPSTFITTDRISLPPAPIKSSTSKECRETLLLPVSVLAARFSKNSRVHKALLARKRRLQRHGITISVRLATATEKSLKHRCRKFSPLRWSQGYIESHEF